MKPNASNQKTTEPAGSWWKLQGIFFQPTCTFQEIDRRPNWFLPILGTIIIAILTWTLILEKIGLENILRSQIAASSRGQDLSQQQLDEFVEKTADSAFMKAIFYLNPVVGPPFLVLISAAIFMVLLYLFGAEAFFKKVFSVAAHSSFAYYLVYSLLTAIVILLAQEPETIDIQNPIYSNLGPLFDRRQSPGLYQLASSIDVLSFYLIYLLGLGLSIVSAGIAFRRTLLIVTFTWAVYVGGKAALISAFS